VNPPAALSLSKEPEANVARYDGLRTQKGTRQQRHLLAHRQGLVDEEYVTKSGDTRYRPGQRLVLRAEAVTEAVDLVEKLVTGLRSDAAARSGKSSSP